MKKRISTIGKVIASVSLSAAMILGSIPTLNVQAVSSEDLGSYVDDNGNPIKQVEGSDQNATFYVKLSNTGDEMTVYQIATVAWDDTTKTYKDPEWVQPIKDWLAGNTTYSGATYASPTKLATASVTVWEKFYSDLLNEDTGADLDTVKVNDSKVTDGTVGEVRVSSSNYESLNLTEVSVYTDSTTQDEYLKVGAKYTTLDGTEVTDSEVLARLASIVPTTKYIDSNKRTYAENELYSAAVQQKKITEVPFGIYVVKGTSSTETIKYNPVTVDLTPYQMGPVNSWYIRENITASLKAGAITLDKKINNKERDTVAIGDIVDYSIIFGCPTYADRITLASSTTNVRTYTMTIDDVMDESFSYVQDSLHVQFREDANGEWKDISAATYGTSYKDVNYYAYANSTYFSASSNSGVAKNLINNSEDLTNYSNSGEPNSALIGTAYYIPQIGDVYTAQIASRATTKDPNFPNTFSDNRGGYGVSVFACSTLAHKGDYQLFLFRYKGQENLYYWYYFRDSAYHLLRVDDYKNKKSTSNLSEVDTSVTGGVVNSTTTTPYVVNLSNRSSYLNDIRVLYQKRTGDSVNHNTDYYADWSVNVFNVTFNVGALNMWMKQNGINKIAQIRILYQAEVNEGIEVATDGNTNKAILNYEVDMLGKNIGSIEDTVYAYTYGLNLVKLDGDTKAPLADVEFTLYKETDTFILTKEAKDNPENTSEGTFKSNMEVERLVSYTITDNEETNASNKAEALQNDYLRYITKQINAYNTSNNLEGTSAKKNSDYTELATYKAMYPESLGYYYYTEVAKEAGTTENGYSYNIGDTITRVFKKYEVNYKDLYSFNGVIKSVESLDGVTLEGLNVGNYILVESKKLPEYNELAEDILFSIRRLDDETAEMTANGSLIAFKDGGNEIVEGGIYKLNVLNYKGLMLPSTGGMGTKIFTIVGIVIMAGVMVLMITKRRKRS